MWNSVKGIFVDLPVKDKLKIKIEGTEHALFDAQNKAEEWNNQVTFHEKSLARMRTQLAQLSQLETPPTPQRATRG